MEAIVRREKAATLKKSTPANKSYPKGPNNNKRNYDDSGYYLKRSKRFQPSDYYNQSSNYFNKIGNLERNDFTERKYSAYKADKTKEKNPDIICYRCWDKGHIATSCPKKNG